MRVTAEFESLKDIEAFVKAWAPAFQLEVGVPVALAHVVPNVTSPAVPVQNVPVQPVTNATPPVQTQQPMQTAPQTQLPTQLVQTTAVTYSLDDLARAAMTLMDTGRQADLQQMLSRFGVQSLPELPPAQYGAFATELRAMGAQI